MTEKHRNGLDENNLDQYVETGLGYSCKDVDQAFQRIDSYPEPKARSGKKIIICLTSEIGEGEKKIIQVGKKSIGVYRIKGKFYAIHNYCPHMGAPLCEGHIQTTHKPGKVHEFNPAYDYKGRILRCPWHGWEFDIVTGQSLHSLSDRVATYPVEVDKEGQVVVTL